MPKKADQLEGYGQENDLRQFLEDHPAVKHVIDKARTALPDDGADFKLEMMNGSYYLIDSKRDTRGRGNITIKPDRVNGRYAHWVAVEGAVGLIIAAQGPRDEYPYGFFWEEWEQHGPIKWRGNDGKGSRDDEFVWLVPVQPALPLHDLLMKVGM